VREGNWVASGFAFARTKRAWFCGKLCLLLQRKFKTYNMIFMNDTVTKKRLLCLAFCSLFLSFLCLNCSSDILDPEFDKTSFNLDAGEHEIAVKSKWRHWNITGLSLDGGKELNLFHNPESSKEMELDGMSLKIDYEIEENSEYNKPKRIVGDYFEIVKPSERILIIKLKKNTSGKDRIIDVGVGDIDYFGHILINQSK
jgi:hypothetical protein